MLTCAVATSLPSSQHWPTLNAHTTVKEEPEETGNEYSKEQCNSFFSEGFHSASPSSSSKDSAASPHSITSGGEPSPTLYDAAPLHPNNIHLEAFRAEYPYNHLAPPDAGFNSRFSPGSLGRDTNSIRSATPKSPRVISPERQTSIANRTCQQSPEEYKRDNNYDDDSRDDTDDEPGLRVPAVNSHGKVKTFKCKQCEFVAVTKLSFWEHSKEHIKPEKMLKCPKCPFVTEYKHHLEYHMRNHFGSKPFRCSQCDYSCVNKSMLNSHLKSHSNIYQYRCADCNYATKYCHSLKLHLRKYRHNPAMVLNEDGTPNPLPIIDVYGTRRGPKMKHSQHQSDAPGPLSPIAGARAPHLEPLFRHPFGMNLPYGGLLPHPFLFPHSENFTRHEEEKRSRSPPHMQIHTKQLNMEIETKECESPIPVLHSPRSSPALTAPDALDLSRREESPARPSSPDRSSPTTPTTAMKNRRKGRAFKLEPEALRMQHSSTPPMAPATSSSSYECPHCEIVFRDLTMHMIHMGFHGYNDPFMCNKCGERTPDRITFFIHLGRAQHA